MQQEMLVSAKKYLEWVNEYMLNFERGGWGVCERMIVSKKERVGICRPDTASELLLVINDYKKQTNENKYDDVYENLIKWLEYSQFSKGGFPFSLVNGVKMFKFNKSLCQNDNGKIIINLVQLYKETGDNRLLKMLKKCANFWIKCQSAEGDFSIEGVFRLNRGKGPCFVLWVMAAMYLVYELTGEQKYLSCGDKAFEYISKNIKDGRLLTSVEIDNQEGWRPVSSENYIALLCFSYAYKSTKDPKFITAINQIWSFCESLIDKTTGAITNGECVKGALYDPSPRCDLVYTEGFAFNALINLYEIFQDESYLKKCQKMADWLVKIQCDKSEPEFIRGGWRGSYDIEKGKYFGICNNKAREGGDDSVYVGWSSAVIVSGLLKLNNTLK